MHDLMPCPFCGGTQLELTNDEDDNHPEFWMHWVYCLGCAASSARCKTEEETIERWNKRKWDNDF